MNRVGVDIGGTFTDAILVTGDRILTVKTPTTDDLLAGILAGLEGVCDAANIELSDIDSFSHGSTIAVNSLIEKTGAHTALLTTAGFRDVIEIREMFRDGALLYNPRGEYAPPLVPRRDRYGVVERIDAEGSVVTPVDVDSVDRIIDDLETADVESVALCFLHSYLNPEHEQMVADRIKRRLPDVSVSISSDISPEIREYSRTSTTVADAYVKPRVKSYIERLRVELSSRNVEVPTEIMKSDGGVARANVAVERPISQLLSGPVAGVRAARFVGAQMEQSDLVTFDMGGTSCDVAVIDGGEPVEASHREVQGMKINGPFVNITAVGAGGGSIARVTDVGELRVGPKSAGARPGPACYGRGGTKPTVTDADLLLGILNPDRFGSADTNLDETAARTSIQENVAGPLSTDITDAAVSIKEVTDSKLASAIRVAAVKRGYDPRDFTLMGFGGAGPMHACDVARELGINEVVFPNNPGLLSALGVLVADVRHESVRSVIETVGSVTLARINDIVQSATESHDQRLAAENIALDRREFHVSFDMRYVGQAHNMNVPLEQQVDPQAEISMDLFGDVVEEFHTKHERRYGFTDENNPVELVNVRVTALGNLPDPTIASEETGEQSVSAAQLGTREVTTPDGTLNEVPYFDWKQLAPDHQIDGPAVIEMANSTVWLPPDYEGAVNQYRAVIATRGEE